MTEATPDAMSRLGTLTEAFVEAADTLVDDFDLLDFLHVLAARCVQLLDADAAGLMLTDQRGRLRLLAASSEQARLLELFELETNEGPCIASFTSGQATTDPDLRIVDSRWPRFGNRAREAGYLSVHAEPMRLRQEIIGVLNLFYTGPGLPSPQSTRLARGLADIATIGLLQQRALTDRQLVAEQLQTALNSRIVIEQAKGVLAERLTVDVDVAFTALRGHARSHNVRLTDLAHRIVQGEPAATGIAWTIGGYTITPPS